jgi:hypothetical protein
MEQIGSESAQDTEAQETQEKFRVMEYRTLRAEQVRRIDLRITIIQFSITGFGAILALGIDLKLSLILLLYPFLMLWVALLWRQNADMLARIRAYIATEIEFEESQWERMLKARFHPIWNYDTAINFLFICSDLIALWVGATQNPQNIFFIIVSALCTLITALLLFVRLPAVGELVDTPLKRI